MPLNKLRGVRVYTRGIDLHYPVKSDDFTGEPFRTIAPVIAIKPYAMPFRCLYSHNIANLFMAGCDISVTHIALGTVRVQRTTGMMGEVVGMAASICKKNNALSGDVYQKYLEDLKKLMSEGVPHNNITYKNSELRIYADNYLY